MKLITGILAVGVVTSGGWAQNPQIINNVQSTMNTVQTQKTNDSNAALGKAAAGTAKVAPTSVSAPARPVAGSPVKPSMPAPTPLATTGKSAVHSSQPHALAVKTVSATPQPFTPKMAVSKTVFKAPALASAPVKAPMVTRSPEEPKALKPEEKKWSMSGKRDPFFSPVVQQTSSAGCSTGKKCLDIGQINVRGVVKSENGFIAVVTNSLNKAYFLRENDPVFNGYVIKITGDTVVFSETVQDKLGKPSIHEVTKRILTPAV